ncbi:hypothetical protein GCM10023191_001540 [Actinoallomurus oryzae]|uniref:ATP-grasp target RiPP n=1 Tax=Actinoallomurus oryzae TaxID=502180 RepID=A0ABP8P821_9ACTN
MCSVYLPAQACPHKPYGCGLAKIDPVPIAMVVSPPEGGYPLSTGSPHGVTSVPGARALRLPGGRDALTGTTYDDGLDTDDPDLHLGE